MSASPSYGSIATAPWSVKFWRRHDYATGMAKSCLANGKAAVSFPDRLPTPRSRRATSSWRLVVEFAEDCCVAETDAVFVAGSQKAIDAYYSHFRERQSDDSGAYPGSAHASTLRNLNEP